MVTSPAFPARIGRYEIISVIGRGGMGVVYRALDPRIGREVAIKVLTSAFDEGDALARFYREAKYTGSLQHQNIVTLYELGDQDGFPYLVMEFLEGRSLDAIISSGSDLSMAEKLNIMAQVCRGLSFAHGRGIVHRDIKPANIVVLPDGNTKIVDFGIAHVGGNRLTRTGLVMGSIFYMSPEQLNGNVELDCRTDIFSSGIVLFQLLTGALPFEGQDTGSTLLKIVNEPAPPLGRYLSSVPGELEPVVARALAKRRDERYSSADEFGFELRRLQQQLSRQQVASDLEKAGEYIDCEDFARARQSLMHVLRLDPDNALGKQRLHQVDQMESEKRKQETLQLSSEAERAIREKRFAEAIAMLDKVLQWPNPESTGLRDLRHRAQRLQEAEQAYNRALDRAATALNAGAFAIAKKAMEDALAVQSLDTRGRLLGQSIAEKIREMSQAEATSEEEKQVAIAINTVEKAIADARMFLFLNRRQEAREALIPAMGAALRVPSDLRLRFEALGRELESDSGPHTQMEAPKPRAEISAPLSYDSFNATVAFRPKPAQEDPLTSVPLGGRASLAPQVGQQSPLEKNLIPEELREFLPPPRRNWRRMVLLAVVVAVLALTAFYFKVVGFKAPSRLQNQATTPKAVPVQTSYAEINAEPWGKVTAIISRSDRSVSKVEEVTPVRISLASGDYEVTVIGPNGETKNLQVQVPQEGGESYFVVFSRPDIPKLAGVPSSQ